MGYRHYMYAIDKKVVNEIKDMTTEELIKRFMPADEKEYFYHGNLPTEEIYELGKYIEFAEDIENTGKRLFARDETHEDLADYNMYIIGKEGLLKLIEIYKGFVIDYYKSLLVNDDENDVYVFDPKTAEEKQKYHVESMVREWERGFVIDTSEKSDTITRSWKYEYALFELTKVLKTFDFENKDILFYGW